MNETTDTKPDGTKPCCNCDYSPAFLLLRLWLGLRALLAGIEKFGAYKTVQQPLLDPATGQPDASGALIDVKLKYYALANYHGIPPVLRTKFENEALLPGFALNLFDKMLGPVFILAGVMLLIGLGTRTSLVVQGLLYIMLTTGMVLINQPDGILYIAFHLLLVVIALVLVKHNKLALLKKW